MKNSNYIVGIVIAINFLSCKKNVDNVSSYSASVTVVNAITNYDGAKIKANFTGATIIYSNIVDQQYTDGFLGKSFNYRTYGIEVAKGTQLTIVYASDTNTIVYNRNINMQAGDMYSLYLSGQVGNVDTLLVKEVALPARTDSSAGVRFINLCQNSGPISINLVGEPDGSKVSALAYQMYTSFETYSLPNHLTYYEFEVKHTITGELIATVGFDASPYRFKNITLAFRGRLNSDVTDYSPELAVIEND